MDAIKQLRGAAGLTQQALAVASGLSVSQIQKLEAGGSNPTIGTLRAIARGLGIPAAELFEAVA